MPRSGLYQSSQITAEDCPMCHQPLPQSPHKDVYCEADILNPQLPPVFYHVMCAAEKHLDYLEKELHDWDVIPDFPGKLYHRRRPHVLWEMVRDHLMLRFRLEQYETELLIRHWSENR